MYLPHAINSNQPDLIVKIVFIDEAFVEDKLKKQSYRVHVDALKFSCLELRPLVGVQAQIPELGELDQVQRDLRA